MPRQLKSGGERSNWPLNPEECLAAGGRRTDKKLGLPFADGGNRLKLRYRGPQLDQYDDRRCNRNRHCRVHHDAQRAMIGCRLVGVEMRHLHHGQEGQQHETHHCHDRPETG